MRDTDARYCQKGIYELYFHNFSPSGVPSFIGIVASALCADFEPQARHYQMEALSNRHLPSHCAKVDYAGDAKESR